MNKEEILLKSRKSKVDEGIEFIENKGFRFGFVIFIVIVFFMIVFNEIIGVKSYDIFTLIFAFASTESITKYRYTSKKRYIVSTVIYIILFISSLIAYINTGLRY